MASPTTPTHGKKGAIYRLRVNGFKGDGLNDLTWGTGFSGVASAYYEVVIDAAGTPDTFKWRKNGGGWTTGVSITGAAQTLDDGQQVTFGATTGHTVDDQWVIGNLKDEACTESGDEAQITDSSRRMLNPNSPPTFTDDGGELVKTLDFILGKAYFTGNVGNVDVDGNNGYVPAAALEKVGYVFDWQFEPEVDYDDITVMGDDWEDQVAGIAGATGGCNSYFIGQDSFFEDIKAGVAGTQEYFLLQLFNYDPDQDQTGDHFAIWANLPGLKINASLREIVKEALTFKMTGIPAFIANV